MINSKSAYSQKMIDMAWHLTLIFAVGICVAMLPAQVFASNAIETTFCNLVGLLTGTTGKAIATVAVIAIGIGALLGKISWGTALIVACGVALVFGAASIVDALSSNASASTSCSTTITGYSGGGSR